MTVIKICGITRLVDAQSAVDSGADMLGFVFAPSKRWIDGDSAKEIIDAVRGHPLTVGVFVNAGVNEMNHLARVCGLDLIQLSGDEPDDIVAALDRPAIKAIHVCGDEPPELLQERIETAGAELVLLDTARAGTYGGTGETFNWERLPAIRRRIMLAGGLHAGNVAEAIRVVEPWGVDVSSGVERKGVKDSDKIGAFIRAARS
ncbi:MAG: phosphoribosylanthranilate isomerase [Chloroflexota bacterium]|nr:phosphoribosylanthranilate isomerase [Chloroflexota bacterium]